MKKTRFFLFFFLAFVFLAKTPSANASSQSLLMATTTSTDNTGLLDYLVPEFEKDTGISLRWVAVGTGKALKLGQNCDVDVLLVHAPKAEGEFIKKGFGIERKMVMYNDFVVVGPSRDPANIKGLGPVEAFKKIAGKRTVFISRGDNSGTNKKEKALWKKALAKVPDREPWYLQSGQGMLPTLLMAGEKGAYTLTDRGTWIKYIKGQRGKTLLSILVQHDKDLFNQYSVIAVNPKRCPNVKIGLSNQFIRWITGKRAQGLIGAYRLMGQQLFIPNAVEDNHR